MNIQNSILKICCLIALLAFLNACSNKIEIRGELKKWHKVTLVLNGPKTDELFENNPFLNYRLDVTFINGNQSFVIPGYFAADGNAAETSATTGNKWMVNFTPNLTGEWIYKVSFKQGENVAIAENPLSYESAGYFDGITGSFNITDNDKPLNDNRAKGRLQYVGEQYLKFAETQKYFIKLGVDAPENLLAYTDFDATPNVFNLEKTWEPHANDFPADAEPFLWKGGKGKNLIGAINYLESEGLNVFSFLTFNIDGDDRNVFPHLLRVSEAEYETYSNVKKNIEAWEQFFHKTRFDVSKLEQWERIFEFAETRGMFLHFKTHETETDHLMDHGVFGTESKVYYRELIARFGHHLSMNWNLGEENNQPIEEVLKAANYVHQLDPYKNHLVIHTFPNQDDRYAELIGNQSPLTGASLQLSHPDFIDVHPRVLKWKEKSDSTGRAWALAVDEPGKANIALLPDDEDPEHYFARANALWGTLMAGGYGVEWYFGYASPNSDLTCQDFRSRDMFWDQNLYAMQFFENHLPFWEMVPADELTTDNLSFCYAKPNHIYVIFLHAKQQTTSVNIGATGENYSIKWYSPSKGGELLWGTVKNIQASTNASIGFAPYNIDEDWVVLLQKD